jgi:hypothetical protein
MYLTIRQMRFSLGLLDRLAGIIDGAAHAAQRAARVEIFVLGMVIPY